MLEAKDLPGWDAEDLVASRGFGDRWLREVRTAVLLVPSVVLQGRERNVLIHPAHPDFAAIRASAAEPVLWDERLFAAGRPKTDSPWLRLEGAVKRYQGAVKR